jgi:alanyl-tRNA synthetase
VKSTSEVPDGEQLGVLVAKTNFYSEAGGQTFDTGRLVIDDVAEVDVSNVQSYGGYILHTGFMKYGILNVGDCVISEYDESRRQLIRMNHTGTHIIDFALREALGEDVHQKGSLVAPEKLRFDFSHRAALTENELEKVHDIAHKYIKDDHAVFASDVALDSARKIEGVRAVSGETYPNPTRVVSIGVPVDKLIGNPSSKDWRSYSIEFCGGTHVDKTSEIKDMVVLEESGVAKGVRRIVAVTGQEAQVARQNATRLEERLLILEQMAISQEKETLVKQAQAELATLAISILDKNSFARRLEEIARDMVKEQKRNWKSQTEAAIRLVETQVKSNSNSLAFVVELPAGCSAKMKSPSISPLATMTRARIS